MDKLLSRAFYRAYLNVKNAASGRGAECLASSVVGFFLGRVMLLRFLNPVAMPFLAASAGESPRFYFILVFSLIGLFTKLEGVFFLKYLACAAFVTAGHVIISKSAKKRGGVRPPAYLAVCGAAAALSSFGFSALYGLTPYFAVMSLFETGLSVSVACVMKKTAGVISGGERKNLSAEELISLSILAASVTAGSADVYIGGFSLKYACLCLIIMTVCYINGAASGASAGVLSGFILLFTGGGNLALLAALSVSGLISGLFRRFGKAGIILSFLACGALVSFYLDRRMITKELFLSAGVGACVFAFLPAGFSFGAAGASEDGAEEYVGKLKSLTVRKLSAYSEAFTALSKSLTEKPEVSAELQRPEMVRLIDAAADAACASCELQKKCWEERFVETYAAAESMLDECERESRISREAMPESFKNLCTRINIFADALARAYISRKTNLLWTSRLFEIRGLAAAQLSGVAEIMGRLPQELYFDTAFDAELERALLAELERGGAPMRSIVVTRGKGGHIEANVELSPCGGERVCESVVLPALNSLIGRKMRKTKDFCDCSGGVCSLCFAPEYRLRVSAGAARAVKHGSPESGDSHSFMELSCGKYLLALSDGMGSGEAALSESASVVGLLEEFMDCGMSGELSARLINSALVLKNADESFSTLDICLIDLQSGFAEFIKIGAASAFILRGGEVIPVRSSSLPMGMLSRVDLETRTKKLRDGDVVVMMTDGAAEAFGGEEAEFLRSVKRARPKDFAESVAAEAVRRSGGKPADDMTIIAARIWEKV
ncbi:MAG: stage II sporulation protein E [Clostridiales bacterium]|jgi:stage II sporulation protein E|nr:stage II sporulation protein E [Clostridiales bacterium]